MRTKIKYGLIIAGLIVLLTHWNAVEYAQAEDRQPLSEMIVATYDVDRLKVDDQTEVLIVVQGNGEEENTTARVFVYTREKGTDGRYTAWKDRIIGVNAKLGKKGLGKTKEGDKKTPTGIFYVNTPFGIGDKLPGFPDTYLKVTENLYWDGDVSSATYNQLVDRSKNKNFSTEASEHLIDINPQYRYCLNVGYNSECRSGKGSAIFLHCFGKDKPNTSGCIAVSENDMIEILRLYKEGKTQILIDNGGQFTKYY